MIEQWLTVNRTLLNIGDTNAFEVAGFCGKIA
ncbi:hypothetical protein HAL1_11794 [Halomonas sp. HAL1]|nr:hypothetical protein HAL1_11794 [Halomonas sp. HAL1]